MARADARTTRLQAYLTEPSVITALQREARAVEVFLSLAAGRALGRELALCPRGGRLLRLDQALLDPRPSTAGDVRIVQELIIEAARVYFLRPRRAAVDQDPVICAAVGRPIAWLLDATAARLIAGGGRAGQPAPTRAEGDGEGGRP